MIETHAKLSSLQELVNVTSDLLEQKKMRMKDLYEIATGMPFENLVLQEDKGRLTGGFCVRDNVSVDSSAYEEVK